MKYVAFMSHFASKGGQTFDSKSGCASVSLSADARHADTRRMPPATKGNRRHFSGPPLVVLMRQHFTTVRDAKPTAGVAIC